MSVQKFNSKTKITNQPIPYTQANSFVIQNLMHPVALAIWIYLLSKPGNWEVIKSHVKKHFGLSDKLSKKVFSLLSKHNLIKNHSVREEKTGLFSHHDIEVLNGEDFVQNLCAPLGSKSTRVEIHPGGKAGTTYKRNIQIKEKAKKKESSLSFSKTSSNQNQERLDKETFIFTHQEMQTAIDRDIHIQKCFDKFLTFKPKFVRKEWENWFAKEKNGKKAKNTHFEKQMLEHNDRKEQELRTNRLDIMAMPSQAIDYIYKSCR